MLPALAYRFRKQAEFAFGNSPLYHALFDLFADWCSGTTGAKDPLIGWLLETAVGRQPYEVPLLLLAGLHERVLREEAPALAAYYPTAGGRREPDSAFPETVRAAVVTHRRFLSRVLQSWYVQTNETGRGLAWLLPLTFTGWRAVDLLDLGASAGLNLLADRRRFDLVAETDGRTLATLGGAAAPQFTVRCEGEVSPLSSLSSGQPEVAGRLGCDLNPVIVDNPNAEWRLKSFVWGDDPDRLARLQEGLDTLSALRLTGGSLKITALRLPEELPDFMARLQPCSQPLVIYNTVITQYFKEKAPALRETLVEWAPAAGRPVLWLQWEPRDDWHASSAVFPRFGWCAWTADYWDGSRHKHTLLGWVHPHGHQALFTASRAMWLEMAEPG